MNRTPKGKQGTRGEKQIIEENRQTIDLYFNIVAISNIAYFVIRYLIFWESFTTKFIALYTFTALASCGAYYFISYMGKSGSDLNMQGHISEYAKDVILFSVIVYILSLISNYFWLTILVAPIYVFYLLWKNFLGPWFFAPAPETDESQDQQKKQKKRGKLFEDRINFFSH